MAVREGEREMERERKRAQTFSNVSKDSVETRMLYSLDAG